MSTARARRIGRTADAQAAERAAKTDRAKLRVIEESDGRSSRLIGVVASLALIRGPEITWFSDYNGASG